MTRTLTFDLVDSELADVSGAVVSVTPFYTDGAGELAFVLTSRQMLWLEPIEAVTGADGRCAIALIPSNRLPTKWLYLVRIQKGRFSLQHVIYMPDADSDFYDVVEHDESDDRAALPAGQVGWLVQDAQPTAPAVGLGWLRPMTSDLRIWTGATFDPLGTAGSLGPEWVRIRLPEMAHFPNRLALNLTLLPTQQAAAPAQLSVHAGTGRNVRITPDWVPAAQQIGWWLVPYIGDVAMPQRVFYPLNTFQPVFIVFVNAANPPTFYGCMARFGWAESDDGSLGLSVFRYNRSVGLPANASIALHPALGV